MKLNFTFRNFLRGKLVTVTFLTLATYSSFSQVATHLVISQVYGGGGNSGAPYTNDYIELFNPTSSPVNLAGWSLQYSASTSTSWSNIITLTGTVAPYSYYLVLAGSGGVVGIALPTPDETASYNLSSTSAKIALSSASTALSGVCPLGGNVVDFIGYGTSANCFEGSGAAPSISNTRAIFRADSGCIDTDSNSADFSTGGPTPRNSSSPQHACSPNGIHELLIGQVNKMEIFPNPCKDELWVIGSGLWDNGEIITVDIIDLLGQSVYVTQLKTNNPQLATILDVSNLKEGVYWIQISDGKRTYRNKIIKQ